MMSLRHRILLSIAFSASFVSNATANWTASGSFFYTDRTYQLSGYTGTSARPVREADVEVFDVNSFAVLAAGVTDQNGAFSIPVTDSLIRTVGVRVVASTTQTATLDISVYDNLNGNAVYVYQDVTTNVASHSPSANIAFGSITMPASIGTVATTDWSSQVFNVLDLCILTTDWIASMDGSRPAIGMDVSWNPTQGRTGSSYSGSSNVMNLSDDDGYDDPNILHEIGHYVEDEYGRSRNTGGSHTIGDDDQDPRLAWSEGFATYVSAAVLAFHNLPLPNVYIDRDSFGTSGGGGFGYDLEVASTGGATNESAVQTALWDLIDDASSLDTSIGSDDDSASGFEAEIWDVIREMRVQNLEATSMEDFWDLWRQLGNGSEALVQTVFGLHRIFFLPDAQEPNDTPAQATLLSGTYLENHFYKSGANPAGDEDWFRFNAVAGSYYNIEVNGAADSIYGRPDPEIVLLDPTGSEVLAYSTDPYDTTLNSATGSNNMNETVPEILWQAPATGTYYVYCRHTSHNRNLLGRYGTYNIRVTSSSAVTPTFSACAVQPMLPGQSYYMLARGDNFSQSIAVSTGSPSVTVDSVDVLSTTALVARLTVAPGATAGLYSVTLTNPGGLGAFRGNSISISATAEPPVMITEVATGTPDTVEVRNMGTVPADLTGWQLISNMATSTTFTFPSFALAPNATVKVTESTGADTATDLYNPGGLNFNWNGASRGDISLVDDSGASVDYLRFIGKYTDTFVAPAGSNALWMQPEFRTPVTGLTVSRSESAAYPRTTRGLSGASPTMPTGSGSRENAVDPFEPNDTIRQSPILPGSADLSNLEISSRPVGPNDEDWFGIPVTAGDSKSIQILFTHSQGNLDLEMYAPGEEVTPLASSTSLTDNEVIALSASTTTSAGSGIYRLRVFGVGGISNTYSVISEDGIAPSMPDLTDASDLGVSITDDLTADTTPTFSGTAASGEAVSLISNVDGVVGSGTTNGSGIWAITVSTLTGGVHQILASANGGDSDPLTVTIDDLPPPAPSNLDLLATSDSGASSSDDVTNDDTPTFSGNAVPGSRVALFADGNQLGTTISGSSWSITTPDIADGSYLISAVTTDDAGNQSIDPATVSLVIDTVSPIPTLNLASGQLNRVNSGPVSFSVQFSESIPGFTAGSVTIGGSAGGAFQVSGAGASYFIQVNASAAEGLITASIGTAGISDLAGNLSGSVQVIRNQVEIDAYGGASSPSPLILASGLGSIGGWISSGDTDAFTFTITSPRIVTLTTSSPFDTLGRLFDSNGQLLNSPILDGNSGAGTNFLIEISLLPGVYTIEVAGGSAPASGAFVLNVDATEIPFIQPDLTIGASPVNRIGEDIYGSSVNQSATLVSRRAASLSAFLNLANDGEMPDSYTVSSFGGNAVFPVMFTTWRDGNITAALKAGVHREENVGIGEETPTIVAVISPSQRHLKKIKKVRKRGRVKKKILWRKTSLTVPVSVNSDLLPENGDSVRIVVKSI